MSQLGVDHLTSSNNQCHCCNCNVQRQINYVTGITNYATATGLTTAQAAAVYDSALAAENAANLFNGVFVEEAAPHRSHQ